MFVGGCHAGAPAGAGARWSLISPAEPVFPLFRELSAEDPGYAEDPGAYDPPGFPLSADVPRSFGNGLTDAASPGLAGTRGPRMPVAAGVDAGTFPVRMSSPASSAPRRTYVVTH